MGLRISTRYLIWMVPTGILTAVWAHSPPQTALGFLSSPFVFNAFFYGLCFAPFGLAPKDFPRGPLSAVTLLLIFLMAVLPGLFAGAQYVRFHEQISTSDVSNRPATPPRVLDVVGTIKPHNPSILSNGTCGWVCENSLRLGSAEVVRVVEVEKYTKAAASADHQKTSIAYRLDNDGNIVFTRDSRTADMTLSFTSSRRRLEPSSILKHAFELAEPLGLDIELLTSLRATPGGYLNRDTAEPIWQRVGYKVALSGIPAIFIPNELGIFSSAIPGIEIMSRPRRRAILPADAVTELGLFSASDAHERDRALSDADELRAATALMRSAYGPDAVVSPSTATRNAVHQWAEALSDEDAMILSDDDRAMVRELYSLNDNALKNPITEILLYDATLLAEVLPSSIAKLTEDYSEATSFSRYLLQEIARGYVPMERLSPFAPQLRAAMERNVARGDGRSNVLPLNTASRFGIDLRPFLDALPDDRLKRTYDDWFRSICKKPRRDLNAVASVFWERRGKNGQLTKQQSGDPRLVVRQEYETRCGSLKYWRP